MKRITLVFGLVLALVAPSAAGAKPVSDNGDKRAAKQECKMLRGHSKATREAFRTQYRSFAACVRDKAAEEAQEEQTARRNAARDCRSERETLGSFVEYGMNRKAQRVRQVRLKARAMEAEADEQDQEEATLKNAPGVRRRGGELRREVRHEREQAERVREVRLPARAGERPRPVA